MHVKQLTTSQAFQIILRKACVSRRKSFTSFSLERATGGSKSATTCGYLRSRDSYLHIPQIYCNTLLSTNGTASVS